MTGIKFDLKEEGLYLSASDSDISIREFIPKEDITEIVSTGAVVISGKYIVEIIKKLEPIFDFIGGILSSVLPSSIEKKLPVSVRSPYLSVYDGNGLCPVP